MIVAEPNFPPWLALVVVQADEIWAVGARADSEVHAEATAHVRSADQGGPEVAKLATVLDLLGQ